jgi:hypothetical protein
MSRNTIPEIVRPARDRPDRDIDAACRIISVSPIANDADRRGLLQDVDPVLKRQERRRQGRENGDEDQQCRVEAKAPNTAGGVKRPRRRRALDWIV